MPIKDAEERRKYQREWMARRRAEWFANKQCVECGSTTDLRLDHIDRTQKVNHRIWSWSQVRRDAELTKCQVLCEPCHKVKTANEVAELHGHNEAYSHGRHGMYVRGCRCIPCKAAHAVTNAKYR